MTEENITVNIPIQQYNALKQELESLKEIVKSRTILLTRDNHKIVQGVDESRLLDIVAKENKDLHLDVKYLNNELHGRRKTMNNLYKEINMLQNILDDCLRTSKSKLPWWKRI